MFWGFLRVISKSSLKNRRYHLQAALLIKFLKNHCYLEKHFQVQSTLFRSFWIRESKQYFRSVNVTLKVEQVLFLIIVSAEETARFYPEKNTLPRNFVELLREDPCTSVVFSPYWQKSQDVLERTVFQFSGSVQFLGFLVYFEHRVFQ